jgi:hypothetical protein
MKTITAFLLCATALAASASIVSASGPYPDLSSARTPAHRFIHAPTKKPILYNQNSNDEGIAIVSQNFTSGSQGTAFDSQGADDFVVPVGHVWTVTEVDVTGVYSNGSGPASSENVFFYNTAVGAPLPGKLIKNCDGIVGKPVNTTGSFSIVLPRGCHAKLKPGTYWLSVQINMAFSKGGEWEWEKQRTVEGNPAAWQNPGNGFNTGCTTWGVENTCWGLHAPDGSGDKMFTMKGKDTVQASR